MSALRALPFVLLGWGSAAHAHAVRRSFEPTDVETEDPGAVEINLQMGVIRGRDPYSFSVPDFEVDIGLTDRLELDLDRGVHATRRSQRRVRRCSFGP